MEKELNEQKSQARGDVVQNVRIVKRAGGPVNGGYVYQLQVLADIEWPSSDCSPEMIVAYVPPSNTDGMEMTSVSGNTYATEEFEYEGQPGQTVSAKVYAKWLMLDEDDETSPPLVLD
jgi:hypothetical protein